ncbi:MAG: SDR family NAD(P)-dependent oxidoreductase [Myxococcota bacterium]|nr:SDR family NAD(P)-dependent oxidoreductase [Myxococcota bacterium]
MRDLEGGLAVITGGASGIGRALADVFAQAGMRLLIADIEPAALDSAVAALRGSGVDAHGQVTDVASPGAVEALAAAAGEVDVLCANAGVMQPVGPIWERPLADYEWVLGVNTWGVVHCVRSFVPRMLERRRPAHIVITASMSGLTVVPGNGPYQMSKHASLALAETLFHELADTPIGVSVLCPGFVPTRIAEAERNRPAGLRADGAPAARPMSGGWSGATEALQATAVEPSEIAARVLEAVREERFWILTHRNARQRVAARLERILDGTDPRIDHGLGAEEDE